MFVANIYIRIYIFILFVNTTKIQNIDNHSTTKTQHLWQSQTQKTLSWIRRRKVFANLASTSSPPSALLSLLSPPFLSAPLVIARTPRDSHQPLQMLRIAGKISSFAWFIFSALFPRVCFVLDDHQPVQNSSEWARFTLHLIPLLWLWSWWLSYFIWSHYYDYDHDDYHNVRKSMNPWLLLAIFVFHPNNLTQLESSSCFHSKMFWQLLIVKHTRSINKQQHYDINV